MNLDLQDRLSAQADDHRPVDGMCPLCGTAVCPPRLDAQLLLTQAGHDVDLTDDERVILALRRQYRTHRNVAGRCPVHLVADCDLAAAAWRRLLELGLDPVGGLG